MRGKLLSRFALAIVALAAFAGKAFADGPIATVDVGATIPISKFQRHASEGGGISISGGYQFDVFEGFSIAVLATPQFATFSSPDCGTDPDCNEDLASIFSMTLGPRFSLVDDRTELFFSAAGGYYRGIHGPIDQDAGGYNLTAGLNYEFCRGSSLGLFIRHDQTNMDVRPQSDSNLQFLTTGFSFQHRYGAPERECITLPTLPRGEWMIGVDFGMAIPVDRMRKQVDLGANIAPFLGYRFNLGRGFALALLGQPQFTAFPSSTCDPNDKGLGRCVEEGETWSGLFGVAAGPRLSYTYSIFEVHLGGQGGYYTDVHGPFDGDGPGFNVEGGANFEFWRGTAVGTFVRYDDTDIHVNRTNTGDIRYVTFGFGVQHRFLQPEPPPPAPAPPAPEPTPVVRKKIVLRGVNFEFNKADIRADAEPILDEAVTVLLEETDVNVIVEGHTDSIGSEAYNQKLSLRRAQAVYDYLGDAGIDPLRMRVRGYGESRPVASNETDDGRAENRRVELRVEQAY
jgi:outer membrane protein OmpA-like peptidoglycan-associated protein